MFEYIQNNRRVVQFFLALIMLPFAFWGIDSFRGADNGSEVATVGSSRISLQELQQALREQQDRLRQQFGRELPAGMMDSPEIRRAVLDTLVNQRVLMLHAAKSHLVVDDMQLSEAIQSASPFQEDGKFSRKLYDAFVNSKNMSQAEFEHRLRQDISQQRALSTVREGAITVRAAADRWIAALQESREVSEAQIKPEQFTGQVKLEADAIKTYYDANRKTLEAPEQLRAEYLVLSQDVLAAQINVSDQEIINWYQDKAHADRYKLGEERHASHILILAAKDAPEAAVKAAQAKAVDVLAQVRKTPTEFARLAKQYSQDTGSAEKGGDLGWFGRGMMVKPFEDAVFSLKENAISDIVRSDFGFHIIKLAGVKAARVKPIEQVRAEIADEIKRQGAAKKYAELAESFTNTVYEQADSLKPAIDKFKLAAQQSPWLVKGGAVSGPLGHPKLMAALFADDAIKNKRNTEAVEVAPNTLIAARILEHKPATLPSLEAVKPEIEKRLVREEAAKLAIKEGQSRLAKLGKGDHIDLKWGVARSLSRTDAPGFTPEALREIFATDAGKLPAYAGVALPDGGYALYRITQVKPYAAVSGDESAQVKSIREKYARIVADEELAAWLATLRLQYPVEINKTLLDSKEKQ